MKIMNWESVEESTPFEKLPAGGYVVKITAAEDVPDKEYLKLTYDIKEGEHAGFYSDDFGRRNLWTHQLIRSYKDSAQGMFKAFLRRLEESNRGFSIAQWQVYSNEAQLVGLEVGLVLQVERYTNDRGDDKERLECVGVYASQDIRSGDYRLPEPKDSRTASPAQQAPAVQAAPRTVAAAAQPATVAFGPQAAAYAGEIPF